MLARALHLLGRASQRRAEALAVFERSAELFEESGAAWRRNRVVADLARLGTAGRRAAGAARGPTALTSREREMAALAALTARQIAADLVLSTRTVETHLANARAQARHRLEVPDRSTRGRRRTRTRTANVTTRGDESDLLRRGRCDSLEARLLGRHRRRLPPGVTGLWNEALD